MALQLQSDARPWTGRLSSSLGVFDPTGDVVAVLDDEQSVDRAVEDLEWAGSPATDIEVLAADDVIRLDATFRHRRGAPNEMPQPSEPAQRPGI